jgi:hypothetical protein
MSSLNNKILFHYQRQGDAVVPVANPFPIHLSEEIDNPQAVYLLGYSFTGTTNPAPTHYWIECDQPSIPIRIQTNGPHYRRFPLFLDNAKDANDVRISHWFDYPQIIASVRNTTNRLKTFTLTIKNPDETLTSWTGLALWLMVSTPLGNFPMEKSFTRPSRNPSYYDKQLGQEDVENILYR